MGKVSELSMLVDELKKCGEALIGISEGLADMFSGAEEEKAPEKKLHRRKKQLRSLSRNHSRRKKSR